VLARVGQARELVQELRRGRFDRPPGAVARDLLDRTAFARTVALGPNGAQRLARLREICLVLGQMAAGDGLDYDAATARMRDWVLDPVELDPPHPVAAQAVQVLTVHQAKGLEFPVVVMWDGRLAWDARIDQGAWRMARDESGWLVTLHGLTWEEPAGLDLRDTEKAYLDAERRRVVYVAATRARDLLVVPRTGPQDPAKLVCSALLAGADPDLTREMPAYVAGAEPAWAQAVPPPVPRAMVDAAELAHAVNARWTAAAATAGRPLFKPVAVSGQTRRDGEDDPAFPPAARKPREGRFGPTFGTTVHRAIGLAMQGRPAAEAVALAAAATGLLDHLDEAVRDVDRALAALRSEDLLRPIGPDLQVEYPVFGPGDGGLLLTGFIDLVSAAPGRMDLIDFKTDTPPGAAVAETYRDYVAQVRAYGQLLAASGTVGARELRTGLLFSGDGTIHWV
jgi:ATP-dependent helicase/nuclease subunit A